MSDFRASHQVLDGYAPAIDSAIDIVVVGNAIHGATRARGARSKDWACLAAGSHSRPVSLAIARRDRRHHGKTTTALTGWPLVGGADPPCCRRIAANFDGAQVSPDATLSKATNTTAPFGQTAKFSNTRLRPSATSIRPCGHLPDMVRYARRSAARESDSAPGCSCSGRRATRGGWLARAVAVETVGSATPTGARQRALDRRADAFRGRRAATG